MENFQKMSAYVIRNALLESLRFAQQKPHGRSMLREKDPLQQLLHEAVPAEDGSSRHNPNPPADTDQTQQLLK